MYSELNQHTRLKLATRTTVVVFRLCSWLS